MESNTFIFDEGREWEQLGPGIARKIMAYNEQLMVVRVKFEKGGIAAMHAHPHAQVSTIISGKYEFTVNNEMKIVSAGDSVLMNPNEPHQCLCLEPGVVVDTFSPAREDFIQ